MEIYYEPKRRRIVDDNESVYTYEEACELVRAAAAQCNMAMLTLMRFGGDMDAVEHYYNELDHGSD